MQAEDLDVVADVADDRHRLRPRRPREGVDESRPPEAPAEDGYPHPILAVVPFKGLEGAKTRLAPVLSSGERTALALAMLEDVLAACAESAAIARTLLVTPDTRVAAEADVDEVLVDEGVGHARAISLALAHRRARAGVLVVMADCPLVQPESLDALAAAARPVALVPSHDGGINALALSAPGAVDPAFGVPGAAAVTARRARAAGLDPVIVDDLLLALDIDEPDDVSRFHALILARA